MSTATASQTIGPYWHLIEDETWADLTRFGATGERINELETRGAEQAQVAVRLARVEVQLELAAAQLDR